MAQKDPEIWNSCPQDAFQIKNEKQPRIDKAKQMKSADRRPAIGLNNLMGRIANSFGEWDEKVAFPIQGNIELKRRWAMESGESESAPKRVEPERAPYELEVDDPKYTGGRYPGFGK